MKQAALNSTAFGGRLTPPKGSNDSYVCRASFLSSPNGRQTTFAFFIPLSPFFFQKRSVHSSPVVPFQEIIDTVCPSSTNFPPLFETIVQPMGDCTQTSWQPHTRAASIVPFFGRWIAVGRGERRFFNKTRFGARSRRQGRRRKRWDWCLPTSRNNVPHSWDSSRCEYEKTHPPPLLLLHNRGRTTTISAGVYMAFSVRGGSYGGGGWNRVGIFDSGGQMPFYYTLVSGSADITPQRPFLRSAPGVGWSSRSSVCGRQFRFSDQRAPRAEYPIEFEFGTRLCCCGLKKGGEDRIF